MANALNLQHQGELAAGKASSVAVGGAASAATLGLAAGVSMALEQVEYRRGRKRLVNLYRDEIAAQTGKAPEKLLGKDVATVDNPVIAEADQKMRRRRNMGLLLAVTATLAAFGIVHIPFVEEAIGAVAGKIAIAGAETVLKIGASLLAYNAVKMPLHFVAEKIMGHDYETTHDRIENIVNDRAQGRAIVQEQVLSVLVSANPELDSMVAAKYGKKYDQLDAAHQRDVVRALGNLLHLDRVVLDINNGRLRPSELAFAAVGRESGAEPPHPAVETPGIISSLIGKVQSAASHLSGHTPSVGKPVRAVVEYDNPTPAKPFADREKQRYIERSNAVPGQPTL